MVPNHILHGAQPPIHFVLHDRTGASIVIEFEQGEMTIYDNEVGVMTNGPQFSWHLANLNNYAHLTNIDRPAGRFGNRDVHQTGAGIAKAALPSSDTSPDRFVRAAYYSTFAEKVDDPDRAVQTLSQVMNNFDRPRGITKSAAGESGSGLSRGLGMVGDAFATEYTLWTKLADLERELFFVRTYKSLGYTSFDLNELAGQESSLVMPLSSIDNMSGDGTQVLVAAGGQ